MLLSPSHEGTVWATYHGFTRGITLCIVSRGSAVVAWPVHGGTGPAMVTRPGHGGMGPSHGGTPAMVAWARAMVTCGVTVTGPVCMQCGGLAREGKGSRPRALWWLWLMSGVH